MCRRRSWNTCCWAGKSEHSPPGHNPAPGRPKQDEPPWGAATRTAVERGGRILMSACTTCGACCASFRVDFSVQEMQEMGGTVPAGLAVEVTASTCRMRGTDHVPARCAALSGKLGDKIGCGIYEWRPSPCREFEEGSDACARARARHGLPELQ